MLRPTIINTFGYEIQCSIPSRFNGISSPQRRCDYLVEPKQANPPAKTRGQVGRWQKSCSGHVGKTLSIYCRRYKWVALYSHFSNTPS